MPKSDTTSLILEILSYEGHSYSDSMEVNKIDRRVHRKLNNTLQLGNITKKLLTIYKHIR